MASLMLFVKKMISIFFLPLSIVLVLMILGLVLLWGTKRQTLGKVVMALATCLLIVLSLAPVSDRLLMSLENQYPPLLDVRTIQKPKDVKWIVVLGGGNISDPRLPFSNQLAPVSLIRLVEGINLYRQLPGTKLLLSGGAASSQVPEAETLAKTALLMGIKQNDMVIENRSLDTADQAKTIRSITGDTRFILVTSAFHMPRAVALFRKNGMDPVPAPTGYLVYKQPGSDPTTFLPSAGGLGKMGLAFHEYLGMAWARLR